MKSFLIDIKDYQLNDFKHFLKSSPPVALSDRARERIVRSRLTLENILADKTTTIYGINTGFGKLSTVRISGDEHQTLQRNLIRSHAVGVGPPLQAEAVRLTMLLKALSLSQGYSGVRLEVLEQLLAFLNGNALPVIPSQGSVGASGDLAPLSHMTLALMGEGEVLLNGAPAPAVQAIERLGLQPLVLQAKEGLALINGSQVSTALGLLAMIRLRNLAQVADVMGALSVDGLAGTPQPFRPEVHELKKHAGQKVSAANLYRLMEGSAIRESHRYGDERVQDIYSLRCMPQIHGACRDALDFATRQLLNEASSVSDNPLIFPDSGQVISAGHFHGEAAALACDLAALAAAEMGNISERRIFALLSGSAGLPTFLISKPGLNSGFMMMQVTAAALASENKTLAHPASVDTIPTGADQEDHVSMSAWASRKLLQLVDNLEHILALEYVTACQGVDFHGGLEAGRGAMAAYRILRERVPFLDEDRPLAPDIAQARELIASGAVVEAVEQVVPLL
ncbi:MAG: histidine ammonia-lyase [Candidatus Neomarinimicrobiota bacterium]